VPDTPRPRTPRPRTPRPAQDESPFGWIERETPALAAAELTLPRELIDPSFPISGPIGPTVPLDGLREYVLDRSTPLDQRDRVWRWLVEHVRAEGGLWYAIAVYLAIPGLRAEARKLTPIPPFGMDHVDDTHGALVRAMARRLHTVDLDRAIAARLIGQARYDVGKELDVQRQDIPNKDEKIDKVRYAPGRVGKYPPTTSSPDAALLGLYQEYKQAPPGERFDARDTELIGRTYFETGRNGGARPLVDVAAELGLAESAARMRRDRAITRMARHLDAKTHDGRRLTADDAITPSRAADPSRADLDHDPDQAA